MRRLAVLVVIILVIFVDESHGFQCCKGYTDILGEEHPSLLCEDYCCWNLNLKQLKVCCSDEYRMVSSNDRDQVSCVKSWIEEHIWVPIVGSIVVLAVIIAVVACCCCGCCR
ncbi:hypothetical protein DPMN_116137 [Dreissena polymorpha]|uniref:Uncharacterized protein n=1 Tax=Dreissena polymorpha TaxID=45954 RepID=A0A9D4KN56_DREPO|nr:hypothetical protein DPMN_116137 [Dreissena polymorpha]